MLSTYQAHYYERAKGAPNPNIEKAKAKIERARRIISDSRIGYCVGALFQHVRHGPSWSQRDDFERWVGFPAEDVCEGYDKTDREHKRTSVSFTYSRVRYSLIFVDKGISTWNTDDMDTYGTVEFRSRLSSAGGAQRK
jgi:hypothetical protein